MNKETFKNIYPVLSALADGTDGALTIAVSVLKGVDEKAVAEEARKVLSILESYEEPKLPFQHITDKQIDKAFAEQEKSGRFGIWSNYMAGSDEDCASRVKDDPDYFLGMTEDEVRTIAIEANNEDLDDMKRDFSELDAGNILFIGTIGRWDGPKQGFAIKTNLVDVFQVFTGDYCTLYIEDGQLKAENSHHDGTDYWTFYKLKEGVEMDDISCPSQINMDTMVESLVPDLDKHFGWKLQAKKDA